MHLSGGGFGGSPTADLRPTRARPHRRRPQAASQSAPSSRAQSAPTDPTSTLNREQHTVNRILHRLGRSTAAHPWRTISAWIVAVVIAFGLAGAFGGSFHDDYDVEGARAQTGIEQLRAHVPDGGGTSAQVVVHDTDGDRARRRRPRRPRRSACSDIDHVAPGQRAADLRGRRHRAGHRRLRRAGDRRRPGRRERLRPARGRHRAAARRRPPGRARRRAARAAPSRR